MKRAELLAEARDLYVISRRTFTQIAEILGLTRALLLALLIVGGKLMKSRILLPC